MDDPYAVLAVARDADADAIRSAYRKLAKQYHPDLNPGNAAAEERFKAASAANDLLSDPDKRARYDRGDIDAAGNERPQRPSYRSYAEDASARRYRSTPVGGAESADDDLSDLFGSMFAGRRSGPLRGGDEPYILPVEFLDAVRGTTTRFTLPDGRTLDVRVPVGVAEGQVLRLRGQGGPGRNGGPPGDALIEVRVTPHPFFRREGDDIHIDLPVTLTEAVLGGGVSVPTPGGAVTMQVPPGSDSGRRLRLRGRGVPARDGRSAGDLYATLRVVLGPPDPALVSFLQSWVPARSDDPRAEMVGVP